jgi:hypothetical protein
MPRLLKVAVWPILLVSALDVFLNVQVRANQAAWQAITQPARAAAHYHYLNWRFWAGRLDRADEPLRLAFPIDRPLAAFYRANPPRRIVLESLAGLQAETAEAAVAGASGWLVVPLEYFMGREGRVLGRIGPLEVAAYRALAPGEQPVPLLYRFKARKMGENHRDELLVRTWVDVPVRFRLTNPASTPCAFVLQSSGGMVNGVVPAGGNLTVEAPMPPDVVEWVTVDYAPPAPGEEARGGLHIRLAP